MFTLKCNEKVSCTSQRKCPHARNKLFWGAGYLLPGSWAAGQVVPQQVRVYTTWDQGQSSTSFGVQPPGPCRAGLRSPPAVLLTRARSSRGQRASGSEGTLTESNHGPSSLSAAALTARAAAPGAPAVAAKPVWRKEQMGIGWMKNHEKEWRT